MRTKTFKIGSELGNLNVLTLSNFNLKKQRRFKMPRGGYHWVKVRGRGYRCKGPHGRFAPSHMCGGRPPAGYSSYGQPRGQSCVRYKWVYSPKLGKKVRRCADFE